MHIFVYSFPSILFEKVEWSTFFDLDKLNAYISTYFVNDPKTLKELVWIRMNARAEMIPSGFTISIPDDAEAIAFKMMENDMRVPHKYGKRHEAKLAFTIKDPDWLDITGDKKEFDTFKDDIMRKCRNITDNAVSSLENEFPNIINQLETAAPYLSAEFMLMVKELKSQFTNDIRNIEFKKDQIHQDLKEAQKQMRTRFKKYVVIEK
jgi:hypothetical protein